MYHCRARPVRIDRQSLFLTSGSFRGRQVGLSTAFSPQTDWILDQVTLDVTVYDTTGQEICSLESFVLEGHRKHPPQVTTKRFESIWQPLAIQKLMQEAQSAVSPRRYEPFRALYLALDQLAKRVIAETLEREPAVGPEVSDAVSFFKSN